MKSSDPPCSNSSSGCFLFAIAAVLGAKGAPAGCFFAAFLGGGKREPREVFGLALVARDDPEEEKEDEEADEEYEERVCEVEVGDDRGGGRFKDERETGTTFGRGSEPNMLEPDVGGGRFGRARFEEDPITGTAGATEGGLAARTAGT